MIGTAPPAPSSIHRRSTSVKIDTLAALAWLSVAFGVVLRLQQRDNLPLWLDETFTGAIASEPTWLAVARQSFLDVSAPSYYFIAHGWGAMTSFSNDSLRAPALAFGLIGPLLCAIGMPGLTSRSRWVWLALVALAWPAIVYSNEARTYALLLLLAIANTLAFARLTDKYTLRNALLWGTSASALLLTQYVALFLLAGQGLVVLVLLRKRIFRLWPALLPMIPTLALMAFHSPRVRAFADPTVAWYPLIDITFLPEIMNWTFGGFAGFIALVGVCVLCAVGRVFPNPEAHHSELSTQSPWTAALAGTIGWLIFLIVCTIRPNFAPRYLIVFTPALLLGLALLSERASLVRHYAPIAVVFLILAQGVGYLRVDRRSLNAFEFQSGSQFLMNNDVRNVTFLWDNPSNQAEAPEQMDLVGGFFFKRAQSPASVRSIKLAQGSDPNLALTSASKEAGDGFIWVYDTNVRSTAATQFPPRIDGALYRCHRIGGFEAAVLSCIHR